MLQHPRNFPCSILFPHHNQAAELARPLVDLIKTKTNGLIDISISPPCDLDLEQQVWSLNSGVMPMALACTRAYVNSILYDTGFFYDTMFRTAVDDKSRQTYYKLYEKLLKNVNPGDFFFHQYGPISCDQTIEYTWEFKRLTTAQKKYSKIEYEGVSSVGLGKVHVLPTDIVYISNGDFYLISALFGSATWNSLRRPTQDKIKSTLIGSNLVEPIKLDFLPEILKIC
jgi:hypothetical protein